MEKLAQLEKENKYLFHGSGFLVEEFEPRQASTFVDGQQISDGEPAVFASPFADYAIFMALINEVTCPKGYRAGAILREGFLHFNATKETIDQLNSDTRGEVYVFNRSDFEKINESEWVRYKKIKPIMRIQVTRGDFAPLIKEN